MGWVYLGVWLGGVFFGDGYRLGVVVELVCLVLEGGVWVSECPEGVGYQVDEDEVGCVCWVKWGGV